MIIYKKFIKFDTSTDGVNSQVIPANYTPTNYAPIQVSSEGTNKISAHLKGIDAILATKETEVSGVASLANNQSVGANVVGLVFDGSLVRSVEIEYSITRTTSTQEKVCTGVISMTYSTLNSNWYMTVTADNSNAGVYFECSPAGQVIYTSSNMGGASYTGQMRFEYSTFAV